MEEEQEAEEKGKMIQETGSEETEINIQETGNGEVESNIAMTEESLGRQIEETVESIDVVHHYELVSGNYTWTEAYEDALSRGGRIAHFDSLDTYSHVISEL